LGLETYIDFKNTDKTAGEALTKNAAAGGVGIGFGALGYGTAKVLATTLALSSPVGWAVTGSIVADTLFTAGFNLAYDNNILSIQDHLDGAGQYIDKVGEQINKGVNWTKDKVSGGIDWAGEQLNKTGDAINSTLDFVNPFS